MSEFVIGVILVIGFFVFKVLFPPPTKDSETLESILSVFPEEQRSIGLIKLLQNTFKGDDYSRKVWIYLKDHDYTTAMITLNSYLKTKNLTGRIAQEDFEGRLLFDNETMKADIEKLILAFNEKDNSSNVKEKF